MTKTPFDTLALYEKLIAAGYNDQQAKGFVKVNSETYSEFIEYYKSHNISRETIERIKKFDTLDCYKKFIVAGCTELQAETFAFFYSEMFNTLLEIATIK